MYLKSISGNSKSDIIKLIFSFFESALELAIHMAPKYAIVHKTAGTQIRTGFHQP